MRPSLRCAPGADTIEHGTRLDDEALALFAKSRTALVPTLSTLFSVLELGETLNLMPKQREEMAVNKDHWLSAVARAHAANVLIGAGSDIGNRYPHGSNAREIEFLVRAGLSPMQAIKAATGTAARVLGKEGTVGSLTPGSVRGPAGCRRRSARGRPHAGQSGAYSSRRAGGPSRRGPRHRPYEPTPNRRRPFPVSLWLRREPASRMTLRLRLWPGYRRNATADVSSVADRIGAQLLIAIDKASAHHAVDHFALEAPTVIDGEAGVGVHARVVRDPCPVEIDDGKIGIPADGNGPLVLTTHRAGRVLAQDAGNRVQGQTALVIALAEQHGQQSLEAGKTRRGLPDTASLRRNVAVHVIGRDDVDAARLQRRPQRLRIARRADRGADLAEVAPFPVDRVRQVVRACLDGQVGAQPALRQCCLQRRCRRAMHHVDWSTRLAGERRNAMNRLRLDKGRPRVVPGRKASFALRDPLP